MDPIVLLGYTIFDELMERLRSLMASTPYWVMGLLVLGLFVLFAWSMIRRFVILSGAILVATAIVLVIWIATGSSA